MNRLNGYPATVDFDIRWSDMDAFGHVNNNIYYRYFEMARFAYYEMIGVLDLKKELDIGPIMAESSCTYLHPLSYPDRLTAGARICSMGTTSFTMEFIVVSKQAGTAATGKAVLVMYDYAADKKVPLPEKLVHAIRMIEQE